MKKKILISLISVCTIFTINAQWNGTDPVYTSSKVGIGIGIPKDRLHIFSGISGGVPYESNGLTIENSNRVILQLLSNNISDQYILFGNANIPNRAWVSYNHNTNEMNFTHYLASGKFVFNNGDVGIGTTIPTSTLDIKGNVNLNNQYSPSSDYLNPGYYVYKSGTTAYGMKLQYTEGKYGTMIFGPNQSDRFIGFGKVADELKDSKMIEFMRVDLNTGNLLIGKTTQQNSIYKLDVNGSIRANEIKVNLNGADFVFDKDYKLIPLSELEKFVKEHKHLPEVAPAKDMEQNGTNLGDLNSKLLQKMEEMTLYMIEQNKMIERQTLEIQALKNEIEKMKK